MQDKQPKKNKVGIAPSLLVKVHFLSFLGGFVLIFYKWVYYILNKISRF